MAIHGWISRAVAPALALVVAAGMAATQTAWAQSEPGAPQTNGQGYPPYPQQQGSPQQQGYPQSPAPAQNRAPDARNPACVRLETQLTAVDRGNGDPGRAAQVRRYQDAADKQQAELDRMTSEARRIGCRGNGFFSLFGGQPAQCGQLDNQIQRMRSNLDRMLSDLERMKGGSTERESQRATIVNALAQNNCGPQYRSAAAQQRGFFDTLFGRNEPAEAPGVPGEPDAASTQTSTYRTLCVRSCDGYYFPISYSTTPSHFQQDAQVCQQTCPDSQVSLYTHRNPGESVNQAVSLDGRPYTALATAFKYRKSHDPACTCKRLDQNWVDLMRGQDDKTLARGDVVVTEEQAQKMAQPHDSKSQSGKPDDTSPDKAAGGANDTSAPAMTPAEKSGKRSVRVIGPNIYQAR
jgi:hypothetical protein